MDAMRLLGENFIEYIRDYYEAVMERVTALSCYALLEKNLNITAVRLKLADHHVIC